MKCDAFTRMVSPSWSKVGSASINSARVAAKKLTDLSNHDYYQYNKYQKITLALNDIKPADLDSGKFKNKQWVIDQVEVSPYNNKLILPSVFLQAS